MNVRVRGIYTTALTGLLANREDWQIVQASPAIDDRFDREFPLAPANVSVETTGDRQGVGVHGRESGVTALAETLDDLGRDTFVWNDPAPPDAVFDARVSETLGSGAVLDLGPCEAFLPYGNSGDHVETADYLRVQVTESAPPWGTDRPVVDTDLAIRGQLATLVRGGQQITTGATDVVDLIPSDPPEGWAVRWGHDTDDASFDALDDALSAATGRAESLDAALGDAPDPDESAPAQVWSGAAGRWCWFGRESRFALDDHRAGAVPTMPGHHRIKAGDERASAAVDFVEAVCDGLQDESGDDAEGDFPFGVVARQFGPREGGDLAIDHGKPAGRCIRLGEGDVAEVDPTGTVTVTRQMSPGGTYDALGIPREAGDVAVTKFKEGRWWYATVYRDAEGERKGTYVNVCTPVEIFPDAVRYVDLHVDVVKHGDGSVERVDDDELDDAVEAGYVSDRLAEKARSVAAAVENAL